VDVEFGCTAAPSRFKVNPRRSNGTHHQYNATVTTNAATPAPIIESARRIPGINATITSAGRNDK
jgi:hypothetical protein